LPRLLCLTLFRGPTVRHLLYWQNISILPRRIVSEDERRMMKTPLRAEGKVEETGQEGQRKDFGELREGD
jgi:hypothetical protein